jgi:hypothetical protein
LRSARNCRFRLAKAVTPNQPRGPGREMEIGVGEILPGIVAKRVRTTQAVVGLGRKVPQIATVARRDGWSAGWATELDPAEGH